MAERLIGSPFGLTDQPVRVHAELLPALAQLRSLGDEHRDDLVQVAVGGRPGDAMVTGQRISGVQSRSHRSPTIARQSRLALGCPAGYRVANARPTAA